jgi:hypothetical protein
MLLALVSQFQTSKNCKPLFVIFSGGYDATQMLKGKQNLMPGLWREFPSRRTVYKIIKQAEMPDPSAGSDAADTDTTDIDERDIEAPQSKLHRAVLWRDLAIKYIPGKFLYVGRLRDEKKPYRTDAQGKKHLDVSVSLIVYDVRGFYQSPLTTVIENLAKEEKGTS